MRIELTGVIPVPIAEMPDHSKEVWPLNLTIESGSSLLISSTSGRGKTSLIHFCYGIRKDYHGTILIDNKDIRTIPPLEWASLRREHISIVFQDLRLFDDLSGMENIMLKGILTGTPDISHINAMAEQLSLLPFLEGRPVRTLSFGQQQRVAILRALVQPFDLLLLDEPFSHLDEENSEKALNLIRSESNKRNAGIVLTTLGNTGSYAPTAQVKL